MTETIRNTVAPPGLKILIEKCLELYPDQPNPLQVTTVLKYWLGGQDPLDYISMYFNEGDKIKNIPPHWHYISFGLSDLHGDGRVHVIDPNEVEGDERRSGMGFELTFRLLKKDSGEHDNRPPTWPANLLQALARYCFQTGNRLCAGDNVPWRKPLDGSNSRIKNLLIAEDAQLVRTKTPFGWIEFCQIVGVTEEELEHASRWNGKGVLNFLKRDITTGGDWLITGMDRNQSVFELFPGTIQELQDDLEREGSDLAGVNAEFTFREMHKTKMKIEIDSDSLNEQCALDENFKSDKNTESNNFLQSMSISNSSLQKSCFLNNDNMSSNVIPLEGIEITLAPYAAKFLILAIKDRVRHGRHFTFKAQNLALTFLAESVTGSIVCKECPYGVFGYWIQVMITDDLIQRMLDSLEILSNENTNFEGKEFSWPDKNLKIIIGSNLDSLDNKK